MALTKKHDFTVTELKAGVMVMASACVFALLVAVLSGIRPPAEEKTFHVFFTDTSGLNKGADVRFGGKKVGKVVAIELDAQDQTRIRIDAVVAADVPVNAESEAFVTQTTLTSETHLEITTGSQDGALLENGSEIAGRAGGLFNLADEVARAVKRVLEDVEELMGVKKASEKAAPEGEESDLITLADVVEGAGRAVDEGTELVKDARGIVSDSRADVDRILERVGDIEESTKELVDNVAEVLAENRGDVRNTVVDMRQAAGSAKSSLEKVEPILEDIRGMTERLDSVADSLQATLDNAEQATSDVKEVVSGNQAEIEAIILDVRDTVRNLREFSRAIAEQPQAVLRGQKTQGRVYK